MSQLTTKDIADVCDADRHAMNDSPDRSAVTVAQLEEAYRVSQLTSAA